MLGKLIKYDMRALRRVLLPLTLAVPLSALLCTAALRLTIALSSLETYEVVASIVSATSAIFIMLNCFAIIASPMIAILLVMVNFYRSLYTDEGYLTFTLPVKTSQILTSKLITAAIWSLVSVIVCILSAALIVIFGTTADTLVNTEVINTVGKLCHELIGNVISIPAIVTYIVSMFVSGLYLIVILFLAITVGSIISKKHKVLASIGMYYAFNLITSTVTGVVNLILMLITFGGDEASFETGIDYISISSPIINTIFYLGFGAAAYIACNYMMKNKLNLS